MHVNRISDTHLFAPPDRSECNCPHQGHRSTPKHLIKEISTLDKHSVSYEQQLKCRDSKSFEYKLIN
jgi:hypothetical protein